ncbi:hypothetical protein ZIOFF_050551 [Zingiber officinale]|uniref:Histone-binding protein RBBP4-like N-terminal domain-containing protein n=1 Tax=Zingiber officinale TaxID=94328 RepID=A0A8J5FH24_ZINOF|nr:hypothetical protein ZIOFF_050551 [Zingiber officinale]
MGARGRRKKAVVRPRAEEDADYLQWKSRIPLIYDWFTNHNLAWPSLSCRQIQTWVVMRVTGDSPSNIITASEGNKTSSILSQKILSNLFSVIQTDGTYPNTLVVANCEVVKPRVATAEHISMFDEESQSPYVKRIKTIVHPGEVNRIREFPQNSRIVATHTDSPEVFIWDVDAQPDCGDRLGDAECQPDLILKGHQSNAEYALAMCNSEPFVLSGGQNYSSRSLILQYVDSLITSIIIVIGDSSSELFEPINALDLPSIQVHTESPSIPIPSSESPPSSFPSSVSCDTPSIPQVYSTRKAPPEAIQVQEPQPQTSDPDIGIMALSKREWRDAMREEMDALEKDKTWEVVEKPKGKNIVD